MPKTNNTVCIYVLEDPITNEVRYVGHTVDADQRWKGHLSQRDHGPKSHKNIWLKELGSRGLVPRMAIIDPAVPHEVCGEVEQQWIDYFKSRGCDLLNGCNASKGVRPSYDGWGYIYFKNTPEIEALIGQLRGQRGPDTIADTIRFAITVAVDRLYRAEMPKEEAMDLEEKRWNEFYTNWAREIAASVGGHPSDVKGWLMDGDVSPDDDIERYKQEWRELGCQYEFNQ